MHRTRALSALLLVLLLAARAGAQTPQGAQGVSDEVLLQLYKGARVTDVVDGMVTVGLMDVGVMKPEIAPLWRDVATMAHRIAGVAVTVRYGPTNHPRNPGTERGGLPS